MAMMNNGYGMPPPSPELGMAPMGGMPTPLVKVRLANSIIDVPGETMAFLAERLGSPQFAATAIRAASEPEYYRKAQQAAAQGTLPQDVVQVANQLGRQYRQKPEEPTGQDDPMQFLQSLLGGMGGPPGMPPGIPAGAPPAMPPQARSPMPMGGQSRPRGVSLQMAAPTDPMGFLRSLGLRAG